MGQEHVIPEFIKWKTKKNFLKLKELVRIRSFIYIEDFVNAFDLILKKASI